MRFPFLVIEPTSTGPDCAETDKEGQTDKKGAGETDKEAAGEAQKEKKTIIDCKLTES